MLSTPISARQRRLHVAYPNLLTLAIIAAATGLQFLIWPFIHSGPFILYYPAIVACALFGNAPLGIFLSVILAKALFFEPAFSWAFTGKDLFFTATYVLSGILIWLLGRTVRRALDRAEIAEAENKVLANNLEAAKFQAETERNRLHSLFMQAPVLINIFEGPDHKFVLCNPLSIEAADGIDSTGKTLREAFPEYENQGGETHFLKEFKSRLELQTGPKERYYNVVFQPWRNLRGEVVGIMNIAVDVTVEVLAKQAQERTMKDLEATVQARDDFMSIASHELRTPLTSLKLQNQMRERNLKREMTDAFTPAKLEKMFRTDSIQIERLVRLVDDMLDVSRIQTGKLSIAREPVDLKAMLADVLERHAMQISMTGAMIDFKAEDGVVGKWDRFRLEQVFANLLTNAAKYGQGQPVLIGAGKRGKVAYFWVKDHGRGIAPDSQERVFDRFERAIPASEVSGLGLGLFIAREIVTQHGGKIALQSEPGLGSTFTVELPLE
jgi:signal transduction histidine kinase